MADLTITPANVALAGNTTGAGPSVVQYGEAVTQGEPLYLNTSDGKYYLADADASATAAEATKLAMTPASADGYGIVAGAGMEVNLGATLTVGTTYVVSATAGGIAPIADLTTGDYTCIIGTAQTASKIKLQFLFTNAAKP